MVLQLGQVMYTPNDRSRSDLIVNDRPYAELLYVRKAWNRRVHVQSSCYEKLDTRELTLSMIDIAALAQQSQNLIHHLRDKDRFRGWHNQLRNEPAFQLALERKFKPHADGANQPSWGGGAIATYALRLGNIETAASASAGLDLRAGWHLPNDFSGNTIRVGGENRSPSAASKLRTTHPRAPGVPWPGVHTFLNLEAKAVAWHGVRLALMRIWCTREFNVQRGHHAFGSIALSMDF